MYILYLDFKKAPNTFFKLHYFKLLYDSGEKQPYKLNAVSTQKVTL